MPDPISSSPRAPRSIIRWWTWLVAVILAVVGVATLASTAWFKPHSTFISFFQESVNGLEAGAPVKFQGA